VKRRAELGREDLGRNDERGRVGTEVGEEEGQRVEHEEDDRLGRGGLWVAELEKIRLRKFVFVFFWQGQHCCDASSLSHSLLSLYEQQQQTRSPSLPHLRIRRGQDHEQRRHHRKAHVLDRDAAPLVDKRDGEPVSGDGPDDRDERVSHGGAVDRRIHTQRARALAGDGGGGARVALGQLDRVREARALEDVREEEVLRVEGDVEEEPFLFLFLLLLFSERARERK